MSKYSYIRDPYEIERQSFAQIKALAGLSSFDKVEQQVAMRLIHTCGDEEIIKDLRFSVSACSAGLDALKEKRAILTDVEMVRSGISSLCNSPNWCFINDDRTIQLAKEKKITRSMAAMDIGLDHIDNSIVLVGNAPTALFRLLEILSSYPIRPKLIIAMPVGFVGAAESKQACWDYCHTQELACITLTGRKGGSALCVATLNALCRVAQGILL